MPEDECWAVRAEAEELRREVTLLRGVVAALRTRQPVCIKKQAKSVPLLRALGAFLFGIAASVLILALYLLVAMH